MVISNDRIKQPYTLSLEVAASLTIRTINDMKKTLSLCFALGLTAIIYAQNLADEFNTISSDNDMMGGTLVVFCEDGIIENISIGKSDLARNIDSSVDTKYRIASVSKTITAIAAMQLVEQNLLDLDADISSILGYSVQNPNHPDIPITVRMLLSHTSSIVDGSTYSSFLGSTVNDNPIPDLSELISTSGAYYTSGQFNTTAPGTYFNYSNVNYVILGTIIEKVSNVRFDVYCKEHISDPLGIDASFNVNDLADIDQLAVLYRKINGVWTSQADDYEGVQPIFNNLDGYIPGTNGGRFGPQGGFRCSGQDLAKIFLVLMNHGSYDGVTLLTEASCDAMIANEWTYNGTNGNNYYGLFRSWGLGIHRITSTPGNDIALPGSASMFGHAGEAYGLVSDAYFDPLRKVGFVFMTNGVGIGYQTNNNSIFYTVEQEVFAAIENFGSISDCLEPVGINEKTSITSGAFPNPTEGLVDIGLPKEVIQEIRLYNFQYQLIKATTVTPIDLSTYSDGVYFVRVLTDNGYHWYKILKQ
ncbi:MAG: FmtA-like protein [Bacteroidota bacterium]